MPTAHILWSFISWKKFWITSHCLTFYITVQILVLPIRGPFIWVYLVSSQNLLLLYYWGVIITSLLRFFSAILFQASWYWGGWVGMVWPCMLGENCLNTKQPKGLRHKMTHLRAIKSLRCRTTDNPSAEAPQQNKGQAKYIKSITSTSQLLFMAPTLAKTFEECSLEKVYVNLYRTGKCC